MGTMEEMNGRRDKTIGVSHSDGGGREDAGKMTFKLTRRQGSNGGASYLGGRNKCKSPKEGRARLVPF